MSAEPRVPGPAPAPRPARASPRGVATDVTLATPGKTPFARSMRLQVLAFVAIALLAPMFFVLAWLSVEERVWQVALGNAEFCGREAATLIDAAGAGWTRDARVVAELDAIARRHLVWIRAFDDEGRLLAAGDYDLGIDLSQRAGDLLLGPVAAADRDALDDSLGPILQRPEAALARAREPASGCRLAGSGVLLVCHDMRKTRGGYVYAQDSSRRPAAHLLYLRHELPRLLAVSLPLVILLALWLTHRFVRPIEALQRRALAKVHETAPRPDLPLRGAGEIKSLASAFNVLLAALEARRGENEAFVADLVHELKNPLATIHGCADALGGGPADRERAARLARLLQEASHRLDTLVSHFLELARAEAGMPHEARERVDLAELARGLIEAMSDDERFAGVRFTLTGAPRAEVIGVAYRLESVLPTLLENAASFSGRGGEVRVDVTCADDADARAVITVADTGPGIAEDALPRVFQRFFTTRGREHGSGLGLALVRAVVEAHGGAVSASSPPGEGATFRVELPRAPR